MKITAIANSNIAFVKYWGKKDAGLNIPMNQSISMTLDENVSTRTTVDFSEKYEKDMLILDDKEESGEKLSKVSKFLDIVRSRAGIKYNAKVVSRNSFPAGSGIASSASGFAALAAAASKASGLTMAEKELSGLARQGSGSAARSIHGGFVEWEGEYAKQIKNAAHWPELRDIIVIVSSEEKKISSREGMRQTVETSALFRKRIDMISHTAFKIKRLIINREFPMLMESIMRESDNLQACMQDTKPPLNYLNAESEEIKKIVKSINSKNVKAAYTFDAGPNPHIITQEKYVEEILFSLAKFNFRKIVSKPGQGIKYTEEHLF